MMSSGTRAAKAGKDKAGKNAAQNTKSGMDGKIVDSPNPKIQPTAEQLRLAQIINDTKESDDPELKNKIDQVTELTGKTRDEAVVALHDCDNDPNRAVEMLLDGDEAVQGEWELSASKKKKNRPTVNASKPAEEFAQNVVTNNKENRNRMDRARDQEKDHEGTRNRGPPRLSRGGSNRGWKGREHEKNERNLEDRNEERNTEGRGRGRMMNGPGRGRGRGGPRSRTFQNRGASQGSFPRSIETWSNSTADHMQSGSGDNTMSVGNWGDSFPPTEDWDNEDWTGSLSETKVFSSSVLVSNNVPPLQDSTNTSQSIDLASLLQKSGQVSNSLSTSQPHSQFLSQATESLKSAVGIGITSATSQPTSYQSASSSLTYSSSPSFPAAKFSSSPSFSSMSISTSQILSSQSQTALSNSSASCLTGISSGVANSRLSNANGMPMLPQRPKSQKARLPPPSKIPSSAVEMPDDAITSLDVQFGALEFGSDPPPFEFSSENASFQSTSGSTSAVSSIITSMANSPTASLSPILASQVSNSALNKADGSSVAAYASSLSSSKPLVQNSLPPVNASNSLASTNALGQSQKPSDSDLIPFATSEKATPFASQRTAAASIDGTSLSSVGKSDATGLVPSFVAQNSQSVGYQPSYQSQKASYSSHQPNLMSSSSSYRHSSMPSNTSGVSSQTGLSSQTSAGYSAAQNQVPIASYSSGPAVSYPSQVQTSFSTATQATASYQGQVPSTSQPSQATYQPQNQVSFGTHQSSSLAQATSAGYSSQSQASQNNSAYGSQSGAFGSVSTVQTHTSLHASVTTSKLSSSISAAVKDSTLDSSSQSYDNCHVTSSGNSIAVTLSTTTSSITSGSTSVTSGLSLPTGSSMNSTTTNTAKMLPSSKTGLPSMPPGVPVVGHQYIMSQASMPIYGLQPPIYTFDDVPMVSRLPPMHYAYDMSQFPSTGLSGRDGLANVAYSGTDGKFSRGDNSSPVPTTLSQQQTATQHQQQTFINPAIPPGYGYYAYPSIPSFPQYGAPIFPVTPVTNATNNTQFQKQAAYGSHGYASGYDNISQTQDYKGGYSSGSQNQTKGVSSSSSAGGSSSGTDMSIYSKTHNQMGKPFDKPGFATGTPPPFNMAGTQAGPMGTPSTPYHPTQYIAMMQQHPQMIHQLHPESQATGSQRSNSSSGQQKSSSGPKQNYTPSYWTSN